MKRLALTILMLFLAGLATAAPHVAIEYIDASGNPHVVSANDPLPTGSVIGSITVNVGAPPAVGSMAANIAVTSSVQAITALSNRASISGFNLGTETIWIGVGTTTAAVSNAVPLYTNGFFSLDVSSAVPFSAVSSTPSTLKIVQTGY